MIDVILNPDNTFAETLRPDLCGPCGGECCKTLPGISSPEQWGAPDQEQMLARLVVAFKSGNWQVDCWDGDPREDYHDDEIFSAYFVRPTTINAKGRIRNESWGGQCIFLGESGCTLAFEERPLGCRTLIPQGKGKSCTAKDDFGGKQSMAIAWLPYNDLIEKAIEMAGE